MKQRIFSLLNSIIFFLPFASTILSAVVLFLSGVVALAFNFLLFLVANLVARLIALILSVFGVKMESNEDRAKRIKEMISEAFKKTRT